REDVGVFDVSHMGEIVFRGPGARAAVQKVVTNDVGKLVDGKAMYTLVCYPDGGIVDDCIVYRRGAEDLIIVVNASNADKDFAWMDENTHAATNESQDWGLLAVQGPHAVALVSKLAEKDLGGVPSFGLAYVRLGGVEVMVARTG